MKKQAQLSMFPPQPMGPTLGSLEQRIQTDIRLQQWQRNYILDRVRQEVGPATPRDTPLRDLLPKIGGGVLGFLVAKYFSMGRVGQLISTMAGYGIGKVISDFYKLTDAVLMGGRSWGMKSLI